MLLYDASFSKNPSFLHGDYDQFHCDSVDETECFHEFTVRIKGSYEPLVNDLALNTVHLRLVPCIVNMWCYGTAVNLLASKSVIKA